MANQVGGIAVGLGAIVPNDRIGKMGDKIVSQLHGKLFEAAVTQTLFHAANQAVTATTVALATTYTGICLSNPVGSGKYIQVVGAGYAFVVAPAAPVAVGIMVGSNATTDVTHTTPLTPRCSMIGSGATSSAKVDAAATLPTAPTIERILGVVDTGAITVATQSASSTQAIEGGILLGPGSYAAIYTSTASGASAFLGSFQWIEFPVIS